MDILKKINNNNDTRFYLYTILYILNKIINYNFLFILNVSSSFSLMISKQFRLFFFSENKQKKEIF